MRKNKTYEQQKKYYDESGDFESLGAISCIGLNAATRPQQTCKRPTGNAQRNVKNTLWKTSSTFATRNNSISL